MTDKDDSKRDAWLKPYGLRLEDITLEEDDGGWWASLDDESFIGVGQTADQAIDDLIAQLPGRLD